MSRPGAPLIGELGKRKSPALDWAGWTHLLSQGLSQCSQTAAEGRTDRAERQDRHCGLRPRYAWVWGASVKHQPQKVGKDHILMDEDIVQIVKKV